MKDFFSAILAHIRAFRLISRLRLWHFMLVPAIVSLLLALAVGFTTWIYAGDIGQWIADRYPWEGGRDFVNDISKLLGGLAVLIPGVIVFKQLTMALASPFMSPLSERVERDMRGVNGEVRFSAAQFASDLVRGLRIALRNIIRELFFSFGLFLLGLIPLFAPFTAIAIFLVQSYYAGFANIDYTMERHFKVRDSVRFIRANKPLALGNGVVYMGLLFIPLGFLLAIPLGTVAATLETVKKIPEREADIPVAELV